MLKRRSTWLILLASLGVRLAAWLWVTANGTPVFADESFYLEKAQAWQAVLASLSHGARPGAALCDALYGYGVWPPLHALLLALGGMCGGLDGARLVPVLLSAATTLLVLKLSLQCGLAPRGAAAAALFHAFYPECVAFSHYLWSETTFAFFLLLGLVAALAAADAARAGRRGAAPALAAGALLGCAGLCRATVLPLLALLALGWLAPALAALRRTRDPRALAAPLLRAGLLLGMFLLVTGPWLVTLRLREGAWKPFSTSGGYNLYLGNHPATPAGLGSAWGSFIWQGGASDQIAARIRRQAGPWAGDSGLWVFAQDEACRAAAREEIRARPWQALRRAGLRAGTLFAPDIFLPRHILNLIYRPMPVACAALLLLLGVAAWAAVLLGTGVALWRVRLAPRLWLLLAAAALLAAPALATISVSRMRFASTLLLLPLACEGLAALRRPGTALPGRARKAGAAALVLAALGLSAAFLPPCLEQFTVPSAHYAALVRAAARVGLMRPLTVDTLLLRRGPAGARAVGLDLTASPGVELVGQPAGRQLLFDLPQPGQPRQLIVRAPADGPLRLTWTLPRREGLTATTVLVPGAFSCAWQPTGLPEVSVQVRGANYRKGVWAGAEEVR